MNEVIEPFKKSLFDTNLQNITVDAMELGIDSILKDGLFKDVPIVSSMLSLVKFGQNIHDRHLLRQLLIFIQEFNKNPKSENAKKYITNYKKKINTNPKKAEEELGRVMVILNRNIDDIKTRILAKLYLSYIQEEINWSKFCDLSEVNEKIFTIDISVLKDIYSDDPNFDEEKLHNYQRLVSTGLLKNDSKFNSGTSLDGMMLLESAKESTKMELTTLGEQFANIISLE